MLRKNRLKSRLAQRLPSKGCWLFMASPSNAELLSHVGFDALIIDLEHGPGDYADAVAQLRAANGTGPDGAALLVRVPDVSNAVVKPVLDAGAEGLLAPTVESADEVDRLVRAATYPPRGTRGLHYTVSRAAHWGAAAETYPAYARDETLIVAMIESAAGVAAIPDMAQVPGVDMFFVGPLDLSASIGIPGEYDNPAFLDLWNEAERRTLESGVSLGGTILPGHRADQLFDRGYGFVTVGADAGFLRGAALSALA